MASLSICLYSLISFINVLQCSAYRSVVSLGRFIPRYFIHLVAMTNGIVSFISLSGFSLLLYTKVRDFCALILYRATLLNSVISSSSFLVAFSGFSMYRILSPANSENFTFPFQSGFLFFFFSECHGKDFQNYIE